MKILVTGGAGFIGSHVIRELRAHGHEVVVLDSFVSGTREAVPEGIEVIEGDIRDKQTVTAAMQGVTKVVHLAALVSVPLSVENPELTQAINVEGTNNVFEAAKAAGIERIVYASSAAVYGNDPAVPKHEQSTLAPESPYASSKIENEKTAAGSSVSAMGLRFFNVYGPGQRGSHPYASVVPRWVEAVRTGTPITLYGDGSQTRDFVHVRDIALAINAALDAQVSGVANIASGTEVSLMELIRLIERVSGRDVEVERYETRAGDVARSIADISRATDTLNFRTSVPLEDGLRELLA